MVIQQFNWFFVIFSQEFRRNNKHAFETVMFLSDTNLFGLYNAKELADYLGIQHQRLYEHLQDFSLYSLKRILVKFMVKVAAERLLDVLSKSDATKSRAGISLTVDNSVIDRFGKMIRCTYKWYSGRFKKIVNGNDLLGIVLTVNGMAIPLSLLF